MTRRRTILAILPGGIACLGVVLTLAVSTGGRTGAQTVDPDPGTHTPPSHSWPIPSFEDPTNDSGFDLRPEDHSGGRMPAVTPGSMPIVPPDPTATPDAVPVILAG